MRKRWLFTAGLIGTLLVSTVLTRIYSGRASGDRGAVSVADQGPYGPLSCGESAAYYFRNESTVDSDVISPADFAGWSADDQDEFLDPSKRVMTAELGFMLGVPEIEGRVLQRPLLLTPARRLYAFDYVANTPSARGVLYGIFGRDGSAQAIFRGRGGDDAAANAVKRVLAATQVSPRLRALTWRSSAKGATTWETGVTTPGGTIRTRFVDARESRRPDGKLRVTRVSFDASTSWSGDNLSRDSGAMPLLTGGEGQMTLSRGGLVSSVVETARYRFPITERDRERPASSALFGSTRLELMRLHQEGAVDLARASRVACVATRSASPDEFARTLSRLGVRSTTLRYEWTPESISDLERSLHRVLVSKIDSVKIVEALDSTSARGGRAEERDVASPMTRLLVGMMNDDIPAVESVATRLRVAAESSNVDGVRFWARVLGASAGESAHDALMREIERRSGDPIAEVMIRAMMLSPRSTPDVVDRLIRLASSLRANIDARRAALVVAGACGRGVEEETFRASLVERLRPVADPRDAKWMVALSESMGRLGERGALEMLESIIQSNNEMRIVVGAVEGLGYLPGDDVESLLVDIYRGERETPIRLAAVRTLARRKLPDAILASFVEAYENRRSSENVETRTAALDVMLSSYHHEREPVRRFVRNIETRLKLSKREERRLEEGARVSPTFAGRGLL